VIFSLAILREPNRSTPIDLGSDIAIRRMFQSD
jgi:hypothetical protein